MVQCYFVVHQILETEQNSSELIRPESFAEPLDGCLSVESSTDPNPAQVLTWQAPEILNANISHYLLYQLQLDCFIEPVKSTSLETEKPTAIADIRRVSDIAQELSSLQLPFTTPWCLCSFGACRSTSNNVDELAGVADTAGSALLEPTERRWHCLGVTPAHCFRFDAPISDQTMWAVLPISRDNAALPLVRIRVDE